MRKELKNVSRYPSCPCRHQKAAGLSRRRRRQSRPRDGRFIERLGYFNPLLPKEKTERLKLDLEKVQAWMKKGAQPSDRVMRFLDAAGIMKRPKRNNPEKAIPRKERKAKEEEAAKAAGARLQQKAVPSRERRRKSRRRPRSRPRKRPRRRRAKPRPAAAPRMRSARRSHLRRPHRCRARRSRRGETMVVHTRSGGRRNLRPAGNTRRQTTL